MGVRMTVNKIHKSSIPLTLTILALVLAACQSGPGREPAGAFSGRDKDSVVGRMTLHDGSASEIKNGDLALQGSAAQVWASACPKELSVSGFYAGFARIPGMLAGSVSSVGTDAVEKAKADATKATKASGGCAAMKSRVLANPKTNIFLDPRKG
ncbi:MAG: hypothetical protein ACRDBH_11710 [Bosea sp. (in: a-proteobacteria)]